jgi:co-chaperonin GroES (HSP10)
MNISKGNFRPIYDLVIVSDMNFGEQVTAGGIIITSDDGKDRGVKPRWGKVYSKGPENKDEYNVGDWILVEHGRWTRGFKVEDGSGETQTLRTVEGESVCAWQTEKPQDVISGTATDAGSFSVRPEDFGAN